MTINKSICSAFSALLMGGAWLNAQQPVVSIVNDRNGAALETLSDNGEWAVGYGKSVIDEGAYSFPKLYDVKNKKTTYLYKSGEENKVGQMMANDVTDDGSVVVGQYDGKPAVWFADKGEWKSLPVKAKGFTGGQAVAITPDGKYAIGTATHPNWNEVLVVWDLTGKTPKDITPANLPKPITMWGIPQQYEQLRGVAISADGSKIIGLVGFSYMGEQWTFVYDMNTQTWEAIGFDVKDGAYAIGTEVVEGKEVEKIIGYWDDSYTGKYKKVEGYQFTRTGEGYFFTEGGQFRPGTTEIAGAAWLDPDDVEGIYLYDTATKKTTIVEGSSGKLFGGIDQYGLIYASNPGGMPIRDWEVKAGKYWYDYKVISRQLWGVDWQKDVVQDEYGYTGTFRSVADNGLVLLADEYTNTPYDSYVIQLEKPLAELCPTVKILDNYFVTPSDNSAFAVLREVKVMFDREVEVIGNQANAVTCSNGKDVYNSTAVSVDAGDSRIINITFRNRRLNVGETYTLTVPEGLVCIKGDKEQQNPEIKVNYTGRPQAPVAAVKVSPEDGISIEKINASSNPVTITFDAQLSAVTGDDAGKMYLYLLNEDGDREQIAQLSGSIDGSNLSVFPIMEQRLAKGSKYEIVIEKNVVADISGADANEEIVLHYDGAYIPGGDPRRPFEDDFNNGITLDKWMLYDGDSLEPAEEPASWGFFAELPWWVARDSNTDTDMAAVAHSMYNPAGKADDWMVTNQIYIADDTAILSFKSQGYRKSAKDVLKVYVYACDDVFTALTSSIVDKFRENGDLVYNEVQDPGASEELLAGDWTENVIKLDKYAGKYIYIAFVNDNNNKSAVFVDDVLVSRDVKFILTNLTAQSVVAKDEVAVKGILSVESQTDTYKGYELTLTDADGKVLSTVADANAEMKHGDEVSFTFPETLKTPIGKVINYNINVKLGDLTDNIPGSVKNLAVETTKRVVIEEYTGQACPNCPLGHAALDIIEKDFGDKVIPLTIHTYPGDSFATPQASALQEFLGLSAAPTARINRGPVASPMDIVDGKYYYKDNALWYDFVAAELSEYADADVTINAAMFSNDSYNVDVDVTYALDMDNRNVNILTVITENGLVGVQDNNRANEEDPVLGEWGKGGIYGSSPVVYTFNDVVRTYAGTTCNGTGGYIPASVIGGQAYNAQIVVPNIKRIADPKNTYATVMLIDAATGLVVNANRAKIIDPAAVEGVNADAELTAYVENGEVVVNAPALTFVDVYAVDGTRLASQAGEGELTLSVNGYNGVVLVSMRSEGSTKTVKLFVK